MSQTDWTKDPPQWEQERREMNEGEWLADPHPFHLLTFVIPRSDDRRHRLFGCACCRRVWDRLKLDPARHVVELAERFAGGEISEAALRAAADRTNFLGLELQILGRAEPGVQLSACEVKVVEAARWLAEPNFRRANGAYGVAQETCADLRYDYVPPPQRSFGSQFKIPPDDAELADRIALVRCIFGNPFRPVTFSPQWRTDTAVALAKDMYEPRDFSAMPILADALQDAGCDNVEVLDHCRGEGPHVRGCWVVDMLLGKE